MNIADYDNQIANQKSSINSYNQRIKELENEMEELMLLKKKVQNLRDVTQDAANRTVSKIQRWPEVFRSASTVLNISFFGKMLDAVKGDKYRKADSSLSNAQTEIQKRIDSCHREISNGQAAIRNCKAKISTLDREKKECMKKEE